MEFFKKKHEDSPGKKRKFQYGANNTILIIGVIVVAILVNVVVGALDARHPLSVDMSATKMFALTQETETMLASLEKDVNIYHLITPTSEISAVTEVLKNYERASDRIHVQQINYQTNPTFMTKYTTENLSDNSLIVECGEYSKVIDASSMLSVDQTQFMLEAQLTNTIASVASGQQTVVYYTAGHGEADFGAVASALKGENIQCKEINLMKESVPADCSLLWINVPTNDFSQAELENLDSYLLEGGKMQVVMDVELHPASLCAYLKEWGIVVDAGVVTEMDTNYTLDGNPFSILAMMNTHEITERLDNFNLWVFKASSLSGIESERYTLTPLLGTSPNGASFDLDGQSVLSTGTQFMLVLSESNESSGAVSVASSAHLFGKEALGEGSLGNRALLISLVDYLSEADLTGISVASKSLAVQRILVGTNERNGLFFMSFLLLPVIVFSIGIYVWQKRRHQ